MLNVSPLKVEKTNKSMDFPDAIKEITDGRKVTKNEWGSREIYGILRNGFLMLHKADGQFYQWLISDGDLFGMDWEIVE